MINKNRFRWRDVRFGARDQTPVAKKRFDPGCKEETALKTALLSAERLVPRLKSLIEGLPDQQQPTRDLGELFMVILSAAKRVP